MSNEQESQEPLLGAEPAPTNPPPEKNPPPAGG